MLKSLNRKIEQVNEKQKLAIKLPSPTRKDIELTQITSTILMGIFLPLGIMKSSKVLIGLGLLCLASSGVSFYEKKKI